jgi:hypothetical protein
VKCENVTLQERKRKRMPKYTMTIVSSIAYANIKQNGKYSIVIGEVLTLCKQRMVRFHSTESD